MYRTTIDVHDRLTRGEQPTLYIVINTHLGDRGYAQKTLGDVFNVLALIADGSVVADGSETAGSGALGMLDKAARVLSFGDFSRTIQSRTKTVLSAFEQKQRQHLTVQLYNADRYFSQLIASEPFLTRGLTAYAGFEDVTQTEHIKLFSGTISEIDVNRALTIEADER